MPGPLASTTAQTGPVDYNLKRHSDQERTVPCDPDVTSDDADSLISSLTADQVCRLTGLSTSRLRYWNRTGFFQPGADPSVRGPYGKFYSFRDVVGLRTLAVLRGKASLQSLRKIGAWLQEHVDHPWSSLRFYTAGPDVLVDMGAGPVLLVEGGALRAFDIGLCEVIGDMRGAVEGMRHRRPEQIGQISKHRYTAHNQPIVAGTRIPIAAVWAFHQAGYSPEAIVEQYPRLQVADVEAVVAHYLTDTIAHAS